jgi:hypothetical protein
MAFTRRTFSGRKRGLFFRRSPSLKQQSVGKRRIGQHGDLLPATIVQHAVRFDLPVQHAETLLIAVDGPVSLDLRETGIGDPDGADLALLLELLQGCGRVFDGRRRFLPMGLIEVHVVGLQPAKAVLQLAANRFRPQQLVDLRSGLSRRHPFVIGAEEQLAFLAVPNQPALGSQHHAVAASLDRPADDLLRTSITVHGGRVDERDALIDGGLDRGHGLAFVGPAPHPAADGPGPKAHCGNLDTRSA